MIRNIFLASGGEVRTSNGPRPLRPEERNWLVKRRRNRAASLARQKVGTAEYQKALGRLGEIFEAVALDWLSAHGFCFDGRRQLLFDVEGPDGRLLADTREIDGVVVDEHDNPALFVEIRVSVQGYKAVSAKRRQLQQTLEIARRRWPQVKGLLVFIRVGDLTVPGERLARTKPKRLVVRRRLRLDSLRTAHLQADADIPLVVIPLDVIWRYALETGWHLNPELKELAVCYAGLRYQRRLMAYRRWEAEGQVAYLEPPHQQLTEGAVS